MRAPNAITSVTLSDSAGAFSVRVPTAETLQLRVERLGYEFVESVPLKLTQSDTLSLEIGMRPQRDRAPDIDARIARLTADSCSRHVSKLEDGVVRDEPLPGEYRIDFVAWAGPRAGHRVIGRLMLVRQSAEEALVRDLSGAIMPGMSQPLRGYSDIDLESVGAWVEGSLSSRSADSAGVVLSRSDGPTGVAFGLNAGSMGNRRGVHILDGAGMSAPIAFADSISFAGQWDAGLGFTDYHAAGAFCATRLEPKPPTPAGK